MASSIRSRLLLLTLAWVAPALAAALWLIGQTALTERTANERLLRETTRALALVVDREITHRATIARLLAQSVALDGVAAPGREEWRRLEAQARAAMVGLDGWVEVVSGTQLLLDTGKGGDRAGTALLTSQAALSRGAVGSALDPLRQQGNGAWRAAAVQQVLRDGVPRATVAVTLLASELQRIIDAQQVRLGWVATIVDNGHQVVARAPGRQEFVGRLATADLRERMSIEEEGLFESQSLDGHPVTGYFSTSPQGWAYITAMPREQFGGLLEGAVLRVAAGTALLLTLTAMAAMWVSRGIAGSVMTLERMAQRMRGGSSLAVPGPTGIVECDQVALALADADASARRARSELEQKVALAVARTREAEQRVSEGMRLEALGRLTGGMAHDFNNLLGVISNSAILIRRAVGANPALEMPLAATQRAVDIGAQLTQHLTRFAGQRSLRPQPVRLEAFLPEFEGMLRSVVGRRVQVDVAVQPLTPPVTVDNGEFELALINLALNARDAMPDGGRLRVEARPARESDVAGSSAAGPHVAIAVIDNGSGIEPEVAARAFEPFFTTKGPGRGTGLGLSQVHGFCRQAGGLARLEQTPGGGTTVTMLLPAAAPLPAEPADASRASTLHDEAAPSLASMRVLLVEDNRELGDVTVALLQASGAHVLRAAGGDEALGRLAAGDRVDVVLTDVVMPGQMDGMALARAVRERHRLPVVLISGYAGPGSDPEDFVLLRKPTTQAELVRALRDAVAGTWHASEEAPANHHREDTP